MENIGNNFSLKCKTRKMGFLYAPKHKHVTGGALGVAYKALGMKCVLHFGISSMKEDTSAQLSGRGELHGRG